MKMTQTSVCTAHFVESRITSGALSKNTFIVTMVWTMKLHNHVCICIHIIIGTETAHLLIMSMTLTSRRWQLMIIWMKVTPLKMKSGSVPSFYSMLLKNIILPMMGLPIYPIRFNGLSTHYSRRG